MAQSFANWVISRHSRVAQVVANPSNLWTKDITKYPNVGQRLRGKMNTPLKRGPPASAPTQPPKRYRQSLFPQTYPTMRITRRRNYKRRYGRRRTMMRRPRRSTRRRYPRRRRFSQRNGVWSRPDVFRNKFPDTIGNPNFAASGINTVRKALFSGLGTYDTWIPNPSYYIFTLAGHGFFDLKNVLGPTAGTINFGTNAARVYANQVDNANYVMKIYGQRISWNIAPDWFSTGAGTGQAQDQTTGNFTDVAGIRIRFYRFTLKKKLLYADVSGAVGAVTNASGSFSYPIATGGSGATQLANQAVFPDGSGWMSFFRKGLERRIGTDTPLVGGSVAQADPTGVQTVTLGGLTAGDTGGSSTTGGQPKLSTYYMSQDAVSLFDSPDLRARFKITKLPTKWIEPGTSTTASFALPSYIWSSNANEFDIGNINKPNAGTLPLATLNKYFPKGMSFIVMRPQVISNLPGLAALPCTALVADRTFKFKTKVRRSTAGGNLYLNPQFLNQDQGNRLPAMPNALVGSLP